MADLFSLGRRRQMLRTAFGPTIAAALADPAVIEVMVNPDGKLWIERASIGCRDTGEHIASAEAERIIRLVAAYVRRKVHDKAPIVSAELPQTDERFEGVMPPVSSAPCSAVRKLADVLYRLGTTWRPASCRRVMPRRWHCLYARAGTSSWSAAHPPARPRSSTLYWPKSPTSMSASSSSRTRESSNARHPIAYAYARSPAWRHWLISCARHSGCDPTASSSAKCAGRKVALLVGWSVIAAAGAATLEAIRRPARAAQVLEVRVPSLASVFATSQAHLEEKSTCQDPVTTKITWHPSTDAVLRSSSARSCRAASWLQRAP